MMLIWILLFVALALLGGSVVWVWHEGQRGLAGLLGGVLVLTAAFGFMTHPSASAHAATLPVTSGLPLADNPQMMPVYLPSGQATLLDAGSYVTVVVSATQVASWQALQKADTAVAGSKRPLVLVVTDVPDAHHVHQALALIAHRMTSAHVTLPWVAQIGVSTLYASETPTVLRLSSSGVVQPIVGWAAIQPQLTQLLHLAPPVTTQAHPTTPRSSTKKS